MPVVNPFSRGLGWIPSKPDSRDDEHAFKLHHPVKRKGQLPDTIDVLLKHIPDRIDQMQVGMCTGCGSSRAAKTRMSFLGYPHEFMPSALGMYALVRKLEGVPLTEDSGAEIRDVFKVMNQQGWIPEDSNHAWSWPFSASDNRWQEMPSEECLKDALKHTTVKYMQLGLDPDEAKTALSQGMSVVIGIPVYDNMMTNRVAANGVIPMPSLWSQVVGGHCMYLAASGVYSKDYATGCNSWGEDWGAVNPADGKRGLFHIPWKYLSQVQGCELWAIDLIN